MKNYQINLLICLFFVLCCQFSFLLYFKYYKKYSIEKLQIKQSQTLQIKEETREKKEGMKDIQSPLPLPSIRLTTTEEFEANLRRKKYGGKGDKLHLGGFIQYDRMGVSNNTWNFMMVRSKK